MIENSVKDGYLGEKGKIVDFPSKNKLDEKVEAINAKIDNTNKWIIGLCISTIIGIVAIAVAVIFGILQLK